MNGGLPYPPYPMNGAYSQYPPQQSYEYPFYRQQPAYPPMIYPPQGWGGRLLFEHSLTMFVACNNRVESPGSTPIGLHGSPWSHGQTQQTMDMGCGAAFGMLFCPSNAAGVPSVLVRCHASMGIRSDPDF